MIIIPEPMNIVPACGHLELIAQDEDKAFVESCMHTMLTELNTLEDIKDYYLVLARLSYEPYCKKSNDICLLMESPVISMQKTGGLYQPFFYCIMNSSRIDGCSDKEHNNGRTVMAVDEFLFRHVKRES